MVLLLLFGNIAESPRYRFYNRKVIESQFQIKGFHYQMIYNMALSLFQIGEELETGSLKELDIKSMSLLTKYANSLVLIMGFEKSKYNPKRINELKGALDKIHRLCSKNYNINQPLSLEDLTNEIPELKKEFKVLTTWE